MFSVHQPNQPRKLRVVLVYAPADYEEVRHLYEQLNNEDLLDVWFKADQQKDLDQIRDKLVNADIMLFCLSENIAILPDLYTDSVCFPLLESNDKSTHSHLSQDYYSYEQSNDLLVESMKILENKSYKESAFIIILRLESCEISGILENTNKDRIIELSFPGDTQNTNTKYNEIKKYLVSYQELNNYIGQEIDRGTYTIKKYIGSGGIGNVFMATKHGTEERVVIKFLKKELDPDTDKENQKQFKQEFQIGSELTHDKIVRMIKHVESDPLVNNATYLVMEYMNLGSLRANLKNKDFSSLRFRVNIILQVANALLYIHSEKRIIHRDIKPENILLNKRQQFQKPMYTAKIGDFGSAKTNPEPISGASLPTKHNIATEQYSSPEQLESWTLVSNKSDIYSLGVVLYEITTGQVPFSNPEISLKTQHQYNEPPLPRSVNNLIPLEIEEIILRCIAKKPEHRYDTEQLVEKLKKALAVPNLESIIVVPDPDKPLPSSEYLQISLENEALIHLTVLRPSVDVNLHFIVKNRGTKCRKVYLEVQGRIDATWEPSLNQPFDFVPIDEKKFTLKIDPKQLIVQPTNQSKPYEITIVATSDDEQKASISRTLNLSYSLNHIKPKQNKVTRTIEEEENYEVLESIDATVSFTNTGNCLLEVAFTQAKLNESEFRLSSERKLAVSPESTKEILLSVPTGNLSAGNYKLTFAFLVNDQEKSDDAGEVVIEEIIAFNLTEKSKKLKKKKLEYDFTITNLGNSEKKFKLNFSSENLECEFSGKFIQSDGTVQIKEGTETNVKLTISSNKPAWQRTDHNFTVEVYPTDRPDPAKYLTSTFTQPPSIELWILTILYTAFVVFFFQYNNNSQQPQPFPLTATTDVPTTPASSSPTPIPIAPLPSGATLALISDDGERLTQWEASEELRSTGVYSTGDSPALAPDGRKIAFIKEHDGTAQLWLVSPDNPEPIQLTALQEGLLLDSGVPLAWSSDSTRIACVVRPADDETRYQLVTVDTAQEQQDPQPVDLPGKPTILSWSPDGGQILFDVAGAEGMYSVHRLLPDAEVPITEPITTTTDLNIWSPAWKHDGSAIALAMQDAIAIVNADGTNWQQLPIPDGWELAHAPMTWSPSGNALAFLLQETGTETASPHLWVISTSLDVNEPLNWQRFTFESGCRDYAWWSPDGDETGEGDETLAYLTEDGRVEWTQLADFADGMPATLPLTDTSVIDLSFMP